MATKQPCLRTLLKKNIDFVASSRFYGGSKVVPLTVWHAFLLFLMAHGTAMLSFMRLLMVIMQSGAASVYKESKITQNSSPPRKPEAPQECFGQKRHLKFTHFDDPLLKVRVWYELLVSCTCKRVLLTNTSYVVCFVFLISSYFSGTYYISK